MAAKIFIVEIGKVFPFCLVVVAVAVVGAIHNFALISSWIKNIYKINKTANFNRWIHLQ